MTLPANPSQLASQENGSGRMTDKALMEELRSAIQSVNRLSCAAKAAGDDELMYAANRAYHQLYRAERARAKPEKR